MFTCQSGRLPYISFLFDSRSRSFGVHDNAFQTTFNNRARAHVVLEVMDTIDDWILKCWPSQVWETQVQTVQAEESTQRHTPCTEASPNKQAAGDTTESERLPGGRGVPKPRQHVSPLPKAALTAVELSAS